MADPVPTETLTLNFEKIEVSYDEAAPGDSFDFTARDDGGVEPAGLLLPAVQMAEADVKRSGDAEYPLVELLETNGAASTQSVDSGAGALSAETAEPQHGLLLPAVQSGEEQVAVPKRDQVKSEDTLTFKSAQTDAAGSGHKGWVIIISTSGGDCGAFDPATEYDFAPSPIDHTVSLLLPAVQAAEEAESDYDMIF